MGQIAVWVASFAILFLVIITVAMLYAALATKDSEVHSPTFQEAEGSD